MRSLNMHFDFSSASCTGRLETPGLGPSFVDEIAWHFPEDVCLQQIILHGRVMARPSDRGSPAHGNPSAAAGLGLGSQYSLAQSRSNDSEISPFLPPFVQLSIPSL